LKEKINQDLLTYAFFRYSLPIMAFRHFIHDLRLIKNLRINLEECFFERPVTEPRSHDMPSSVSDGTPGMTF